LAGETRRRAGRGGKQKAYDSEFCHAVAPLMTKRSLISIRVDGRTGSFDEGPDMRGPRQFRLQPQGRDFDRD
jgi:hypothetical protein